MHIRCGFPNQISTFSWMIHYGLAEKGSALVRTLKIEDFKQFKIIFSLVFEV